MKKIYIILVLFVLQLTQLSSQDVVGQAKMVKGAIEQPQMDGAVIAAHYREWTGKRVIVSNAAQAKAISFIQPGPLSYREAAQLLEKACLLEGLVFVPSGVQEVKLVLAGNVKPQGVPFLKDKDLLPRGDAVVSYFMQFSDIAPDEALKAFESIAGKVKKHGSITVVENANAIIITENSALIRSLIKIKEVIDIPQSRVSRKMVALTYADADKMVEQIKLIIDSEGEKKSPRVTAPKPEGAKVTNEIGSVQKISVLADERTNSIFLMGRPIDILLTESLIKDFDQPAKQQNFSSYKLKYLPVGEFLPVAADAIKRISPSKGSSRSARTPTVARQASSSGGRGASLAESERAETPQSLLVGKTHLVADSTNNTLIVEGPPQSISIVKNLITKMDIPAKQVQITAIFGRYKIDGESSFGVDFARAYQTNGGDSGVAGQSSTGFPIITNPANLTGSDSFPSPANAIAGLAIYGNVGKHFFSYLRALESSGKFKLLARPTLFTTNNRKALLSSGQRIAVPTSTLSQQSATLGNSVSQNTNIEFRDVLLKLEVIPLVNSANEVTLKISFLNDNVVGNQTINGNSIPTIGTEELYTTVKVPNNGTVVLGGLITETSKDNKAGVPILSRIPGLGKIFSSTSKVTSREELVILIKPKIVDGPQDLLNLQQSNASRSDLLREVYTEDADTEVEDKSRKKSGKSPRSRFKGRRR